MLAARCDLKPEDCITDHLCPVLDGRAQSSGGWRAKCPAHEDDRPSLTLDSGTRGARIVWTCHKGCSGLVVRRAMVDLGVRPACLGSVRQPAEPPARSPEVDDDLRTRIEQAITDAPDGVQRLRVEIGTILWGCDRQTAAERLGVPRATRYREGWAGGCARPHVRTMPSKIRSSTAGHTGVSSPP